MSIVNTETGEVIGLDRAAAERRAERIRLRLDAIADNYAAVMPMIREAVEKRDDLALGYRSVSEYVADRFGGALQNLGVEVRREVVRELTAAGMSTRSIAPVVGVNNATVHRDLARVADATPPPPVADAAGAAPVRPEPTPKAAPVERGVAAAAVTKPLVDATVATPEAEPPAPARPPVVGIDGKTYTRPAAASRTACVPRTSDQGLEPLRPRPPNQRSDDHCYGADPGAVWVASMTSRFVADDGATGDRLALTAAEKDELDSILLALWQTESVRGYEFSRSKVESAVERIIAERMTAARVRVAHSSSWPTRVSVGDHVMFDVALGLDKDLLAELQLKQYLRDTQRALRRSGLALQELQRRIDDMRSHVAGEESGS